MSAEVVSHWGPLAVAVNASDAAGACTYTPKLKTFDCYNLGGADGLPGGYDDNGELIGNGCANTGTVSGGRTVTRGTEWWCNVPASPTATCTLCAAQGWERDCQSLCTQAAPAAGSAPNYKCHAKTAAADRTAGCALAIVAAAAAAALL